MADDGPLPVVSSACSVLKLLLKLVAKVGVLDFKGVGVMLEFWAFFIWFKIGVLLLLILDTSENSAAGAVSFGSSV